MELINLDTMSQPVFVSLEFTPNPDTLKYAVNRVLSTVSSKSFSSAAEALAVSPLAAHLLANPGVAGIMIGRDFVTVSKASDAEWDKVHQAVSHGLEEYLSAGKPVFSPDFVEAQTKVSMGEGATVEILERIRQVLEDDIRPAIQSDGGDISLEGFQDGIVLVSMHGACVGCPSSTATLRMGVEARLKSSVPEVRGVAQV